MVLGSALIAAAGPTLVVCGPWRDRLLNFCLADLQGTVSTGSVSVGWFSPLLVSQLSVADPQGQPVLSVSALATERSLLGLLLQPSHLGTITLDGAQVELVLREDGSNLEDLFAHWLTAPQPGSATPPGCELNIHDARLTIRDTASSQECAIDPLNMQATVKAEPGLSLEATVEGTLKHDGHSGPLAIKISNQPSQASGAESAAAGSLTVKVNDFPLAICQALACRVQPHSKLTGTLAADFNCQWGTGDRGQPRRSAAGQLQVAALTVGGPWLNGDRLALSKLVVPCQATWEGNRLEIRRLQADCDVGQVSIQGALVEPQKVLNVGSPAELVAALNGSSADISGKIDLAQLANLLPRAVGLKRGLRLTAGTLAWQLSGKEIDGNPSYRGTLDASKLVAQHEGRELTWESPLQASFAAHGQGTSAVLDQLQCQSDFVQVTGQGTSRQLQLSGKFDLGRLTEELGQFIDFGSRRMDGQGTFSANYQCDASEAFTAAAQFNLDQLQLSVVGGPWTDQPWAWQAQLQGQLPTGKAWRIDAADLRGQLGGDAVEVKLVQSVSGSGANCQIPLAAHITGQAGSWLTRLQACTGVLPGFAAAGQLDVQLAANCSPAAIDVNSAVITCQPLEVRGPQLALEEAEARIEAAGRLELADQRATGCKARVQTTSFSADLANGTLTWAAAQRGASGMLEFAGDLSRMQNSLGLAAGDWRLAGTVSGKGTIGESGPVSSLDLNASVDHLLASPARGQAIAGGKTDLTLKVQYDNSADALRLTACQVAAEGMTLQAAGTIEHASSGPIVDLKGTWQYDLATLTALLEPKFGSNIQLAGREARAFRLQGPLVAAISGEGPANPDAAGAASPPSAAAILNGQVSLGWQ
ncbi:MAG TPA: hypothetical protein VHY20_10065, partial [Pirellulales bacterium]|nr:hypothetical protein [Pirellulales bacterium]